MRSNVRGLGRSRKDRSIWYAMRTIWSCWHRRAWKTGKSVEFLGYQFYYARSWKTGKRLVLVRPSTGSQQRCREQIRTRLHHSIPKQLKEEGEDVNKFLRGWVGYYRVGHASEAFRPANNFVNKRVRHIL